jgi:hypothetical protein
VSDDGKMSTTKVLGLVGLVVSAVAGIATLLFTLDPDLKPCIGGAEASFTGAPVFPNTPKDRHLERSGAPRSVVRDAAGQLGAEVRFSFHVSGLRGETLSVRYSLVRVGRDGAFGAIDPEADRGPGITFKSEACSEIIGQDLFINKPESPSRHRYRVVLELYRGDSFDQRLGLTQTAIFSQ